MSLDLEKHMEEVRFANVIFFTLGKDFIDVADIQKEFNVDTKTAEQYIRDLNAIHIIQGIQVSKDTTVYRVLVESYAQLNKSFVDRLKSLGRYTDEQIIAQIEPDDHDKAEYSQILDDDKWNWHTSNEIPTEDKLLYIRIRNDEVTLRSKSTITYLEDSRLARYINGEYVLQAPFTKYDFSPLTNRDTFRDGAKVTHWAYATEEDLDLWQHRFDFIGQYEQLDIIVDEENEENVYDALVLASASLGSALTNCIKGDPMIEKLESARNIISDMQSVFDQKQYPKIYPSTAYGYFDEVEK